MISLAIALALLLVMSGNVLAQVSNSGDVTANIAETPFSEYKATQLPAEVGKPVQWVKQVEVHNIYDQTESELLVAVKQDEENIVAVDKKDGEELEVVVETDEISNKGKLETDEQKNYMIKYAKTSPEKSETQRARCGEALG